VFGLRNKDGRSQASRLVARLSARGKTLATAESLTGGLIGSMITAVPGSSSAYWGGFVTYAVDAKVRLLGVDPDCVRVYGVVSAETAIAMALGAMRSSPADLAIAVTGVAGPGGGTPEVPVGTVWVAAVSRKDGHEREPVTLRLRLRGRRGAVRRQTALSALDLADRMLDSL
jgi:PncC family amidohydrolase